MTLRARFKSDVDKVVNGEWFEYPDDKNPDGSIPRFRLARMSYSNPKYAKALQAIADRNDTKKFTSEEDDQAGLEAFVDTVLLEWQNFQPETDGANLEYSRDAALKTFANAAWYDLKVDLRFKAVTAANYRAEKVAAIVGN